MLVYQMAVYNDAFLLKLRKYVNRLLHSVFTMKKKILLIVNTVILKKLQRRIIFHNVDCMPFK